MLLIFNSNFNKKKYFKEKKHFKWQISTYKKFLKIEIFKINKKSDQQKNCLTLYGQQKRFINLVRFASGACKVFIFNIK